MLDTYAIRQTDMPQDMWTLLQQYPRDSWDAHPGFHEKTQHWLQAHQMFRRTAEQIRTHTESMLNKDMDLENYVQRLSYFGDGLVRALHGHHGWEDRSYFPELSAADPRFDAGLDVLEKDHADLDIVLDDFKRSANRVIKLSTLDPSQAFDGLGQVHMISQTIEAFLDRHLTDEEELAVPIILHHRLRG